MRGLGLGIGMASVSGPQPFFTDTDLSDWTRLNVTAGQDAEVDPATGLVATKILETTATATHTVSKTFTTAIGEKYRIRFSVKGIGRDRISANLVVTPNTYWIGLIASDTGSLTLNFTKTVTDLGNGWYEITHDMVAPCEVAGSIYSYSLRGVLNGTSTTSYLGDITKGYYIGQFRAYRIP